MTYMACVWHVYVYTRHTPAVTATQEVEAHLSPRVQGQPEHPINVFLDIEQRFNH